MTASDDGAAGRPPLLCPSAQPDWENSVAFGIVGGTAQAPRVTPLQAPQPVTPALLALSAPAHPAEVFRFAAPCAGTACRHFDGAQCRLVRQVIRHLPVVTDALPFCRLRPRCRWFQQEGAAACRRCPQIVTETHHPSDEYVRAVAPDEAS